MGFKLLGAIADIFGQKGSGYYNPIEALETGIHGIFYLTVIHGKEIFGFYGKNGPGPLYSDRCVVGDIYAIRFVPCRKGLDNGF